MPRLSPPLTKYSSFGFASKDGNEGPDVRSAQEGAWLRGKIHMAHGLRRIHSKREANNHPLHNLQRRTATFGRSKLGCVFFALNQLYFSEAPISFVVLAKHICNCLRTPNSVFRRFHRLRRISIALRQLHNGPTISPSRRSHGWPARPNADRVQNLFRPWYARSHCWTCLRYQTSKSPSWGFRSIGRFRRTPSNSTVFMPTPSYHHV